MKKWGRVVGTRGKNRAMWRRGEGIEQCAGEGKKEWNTLLVRK